MYKGSCEENMTATGDGDGNSDEDGGVNIT